jgi:hypothetical protein
MSNLDRVPLDPSGSSVHHAHADATHLARSRMQRAIREYMDTLTPSGVELAAAVSHFTRAMRDDGARPEAVVVEVKREAAAVLNVPRDQYSLYRRTPFARLVDRLVTWAVEAYYGDD